MKQYVWLLLCFLVSTLQQVRAADTAWQFRPVKTIAGSYSGVYTDNLQNIYLLSASRFQIKKLNSNGDSAAVFNNVLRYGKIYSVDVSNPLKILVFYRQFSTIVILDRFLASRAVVDLRKSGITQVKAVAQSYDSNIWLYDEGDGRIKKLDENNNLLLESADLRLVFDESLSPEKIIDNNGQLYLYDKQLGWLLFDYYGGFKKKIPYTGWTDAGAINNGLVGRMGENIVYASQSDIIYHNIKTNINLPEAIQTSWQQSLYYVLYKEGLQVFRMGNP